MVDQPTNKFTKKKGFGKSIIIEKGKSLVKDDLSNRNIPVIVRGRVPAYYHDQATYSGRCITISALGAYAKDLKNITICLPLLAQQKSIAQALSAAQHEITLLQKLAQHYRAQKQGLMQKLLNGEWRTTHKEIK